MSDSQENDVVLKPAEPKNTPENDPPVETTSTDSPAETQTKTIDPPIEPQNKTTDLPIEPETSTEPTTEQQTGLPTLSELPDKPGFDRQLTIIEFAKTMMSNIIDQELFLAITDIAIDSVAENCAKQTVSSPTISSGLSEKSGPATKGSKTYSNQKGWSCEECDPYPVVTYRNNQRGSSHFSSKKHLGTTHVLEKRVCPKCGPGAEQKLTVTEYAQRTVPRWKKITELKCCDLNLTKIRVKPIKE